MLNQNVATSCLKLLCISDVIRESYVQAKAWMFLVESVSVQNALKVIRFQVSGNASLDYLVQLRGHLT